MFGWSLAVGPTTVATNGTNAFAISGRCPSAL